MFWLGIKWAVQKLFASKFKYNLLFKSQRAANEKFDTSNSFDNDIKHFLNSDCGEPLNVKDHLLIDEFESDLKYKETLYEVKLPFTCSKDIIPDNYLLAKIRMNIY